MHNSQSFFYLEVGGLRIVVVARLSGDFMPIVQTDSSNRFLYTVKSNTSPTIMPLIYGFEWDVLSLITCMDGYVVALSLVSWSTRLGRFVMDMMPTCRGKHGQAVDGLIFFGSLRC